jgi:RNA polymerase sigma-70 factor (ECF subfamily)
MDPQEHAIMAAALRGDRESFEAVIHARSRALFAVAFAVLQDAAEAEDVVQETFLRAWSTRWRLRDPEKLPGWLAAVARNRACDVLRRRRRGPIEARSKDTPEPEDAPSARPDAQLDGAERSAQVQAALAQLPEAHRTAVTLRYMEGLDHLAIEQTMGLSNGALRGILGRGMAALRKNLKPMEAAYERYENS